MKWGSSVSASTPLQTGGDDYTPPKRASWDDINDVGLFEGGDGHYITGIYRAVVDCG